jgi:Phytanoyl-CoA dioxygenase (PhyH)
MTMNSQETYLFDLQGYITVPDALSAEQLTTLNAIWDERIARDIAPDKPNHRWGDLFSWGRPFLDLIDPPVVRPYLDVILGKNFRLDHEYADLIRTGKSPIGSILHGGGAPFDSGQYYHWRDGRMHNGLVVVAYNLRDVHPGDGGFGCVPGSHKSNLPFPSEWRDLADFKPFMRAVTGPAGTAIIFTEALTHGAMPWTGAGERRTLFYKYSPFPLSWSANYYDPNEYADLTDAQRQILEAPNARYGGRVTKIGKR